MMIGDTSSAIAAGTRAAADQEQIEEDLNDFLLLLTTQLQNQDPLEPMNANEFTQQLVQFASVEQQIQQNANLENLVDLAANNQVGAMVSFLEKRVEFAGDQLTLRNGEAEASYALSDPAKSVTINVIDASGNTVFSKPGAETAGRHAFTWDGRDNAGNVLADGKYTLSVTATDGEGANLNLPTTVTGTVDSVGSAEGRLALMVGDAAVDLEQLISVVNRRPTLAEQAAEVLETDDGGLF